MSISYYDVLVDYEALVNQVNEVLQVLEEHQDYSNHAPIAVSIYALRGLVDTHKKNTARLFVWCSIVRPQGNLTRL